MQSTDNFIFTRAISRDSLETAWAHISRFGGPAAGGDGLSRRKFAPNAAHHLARLAQELASGLYRPGPVRTVEIPKKSGGVRTLSLPCMIDRIAQRSVAQHLSAILEPHFENSSYAYRPGRSVKLASQTLVKYYRQGLEWVYESDVDDYFDSVPHDKMLERLYQHVPDAGLQRLVSLWLNMDGDQVFGLPQGGAISPVLANLYLDPLDEVMARSGRGWVRYADDFVCLAYDEAAARAARRDCVQTLSSLGLKENPDKTQIARFDGGVRFLGRLFLKSMMMEDADGLEPEEEAALRAYEAARVDPDSGKSGPDAPIVTRRVAGLVVDTLEKVALRPVEPDEVEGGGKTDDADNAPPSDREARPVTFAPVTRTLYLNRAGHALNIQGKTFVVHDQHMQLLWAKSPNEVDRIDIGPKAEIDSAALRHAARHNISVFYVDGLGRTQGILSPPMRARGKLHLAQAAISLEPVRRLDMARTLARGRCTNQYRLIKRWVQNNKEALARAKKKSNQVKMDIYQARIESLEFTNLRLDHEADKIDSGKSVAEVMRAEARAGRFFWQAFRENLRHFEMGPRRRRRYIDPANAVLNYTSWLLARDIRSLIDRSGLHPDFGILHSTRNGFSACVYDLIEEFRAPVAEALSMMLLNRGPLKPDDFVIQSRGGKTGSSGSFENYRLLPSAADTLTRQYEKFVSSKRVKRASDGRYSHWRGVMRDQMGLYIKAVTGQVPYQPYKMDF